MKKELDDIIPTLHKERIENSILAALMAVDSNKNYSYISEIITADMFYNSTNRKVWEIIKERQEENKPCNLVAVQVELQKYIEGNAIAEVMRISGDSDCNILITECASILSDLYTRRKNFEFAVSIIDCINKLPTDEQKEAIRQHLEGIDRIATKNAVKSHAEAIKAVHNKIDANLKNSGNPDIIRTGFADIDERGGYSLGELNLIGADSGIGKTSLALKIAYNIASAGIPIAYYSLEMSAERLATRFLSFGSGVAIQRIRNKALTAEELARTDEEEGKQYHLPIYYDDDNKATIDEVCNSIRSLHRRKGIKVAFVDYLQMLIDNNTKQRDTEATILASLARRLKNLALELNIIIVALVQFNSADDDELPTLRRIYGSGQIKSAADNIHLIHRIRGNGSYPSPFEKISTTETALILCKKGRDCGEYSFICGFHGECVDYYPLMVENYPTRTINKKDDDLYF